MKRYRYTGKERDEETGLYYHGARYYIPWLARWSAVDPLESEYAPQSPYVYCSNNPVIKVDLTGKGETDPPIRTYFINSNTGEMLGEVEGFQETTPREKISDPENNINYRSINPLNWKELKDSKGEEIETATGDKISLESRSENIKLNKEKIHSDLFEIANSTSNKEQHLVIFFDARNNEISSEKLPDTYNTNESTRTDFYLSTTNQKITYLNPSNAREEIKDRQERLNIASREMKLVLAYVHTHPLIDQKFDTPGMNSSFKTKTNEPGVSPRDKAWSKLTTLPNFVLESFSKDKFVSLSMKGGEKKRFTNLGKVMSGAYDIVYNSLMLRKNAR